MVDEHINSMQKMGCTRMSNKMHLLYKHKNKYEKYLGKFFDEHGERLHKEMETIEMRYSPNLTREILTDYVSSLKRSGGFSFVTKKVCFKFCRKKTFISWMNKYVIANVISSFISIAIVILRNSKKTMENTE